MNDITPDLASLSIEEKASLTSGADFWTTKSIEHAQLPSVMLTDGPHGLRKQAGASDHLGVNSSVPATCFPPAVALGSSFDPDLAERVGAAIGVEAAIEDVAVVLGPGINLKRSPLCGRNFEYLSEDPLLSGIMGAGLVRGIQSQGVGASLKHFAANNQETDRMRVSADIDPRPLRELYLRSFEWVVKDAAPWTVMCSYNRINGVHASENPWLLNQVLRTEWGFKGLVVSDWGAVRDRVQALAAGLDLEMPGGGGSSDAQVVAAVRSGALPEEVLDTAAGRNIDLVRKYQARPAAPASLDIEAHHALAREAAARSIVLLKNDGALLPLAQGASVAVIGEFARTPRFQGGGSSHINPTKLDSALDAFHALCGDNVRFAPGFSFDGSDLDGSGDERLRTEAVAAASASDVAVVFLGLTSGEESEGFDRRHIDLAPAQLTLVDAVLEANPRTVVVLSHGAVVTLPFADRVPAIVEGWLLGQAGGTAIVDVLTGRANPSGRLAETVPKRLEDTPAFGAFPGEAGHVRYGEGLYVGYRWYDKRQIAVEFPFGFGLSYSTFEYGLPEATVTDAGDLRVCVRVSNTSERDGREVVQVYVAPVESAVERAPRELKAFASVEIAASASRDVTLTVRRDDLAYWNTRVDRWVVEGGDYRIEVGASSRDIRGAAIVAVVGDDVRLPLTSDSTLGEMMAHPVVGPLLREKVSAMQAETAGEPAGDAPADDIPAAAAPAGGDDGALDAATVAKLMESFPIGRLANFPGSGISAEQVEQLISLGNADGAGA